MKTIKTIDLHINKGGTVTTCKVFSNDKLYTTLHIVPSYGGETMEADEVLDYILRQIDSNE